MNSGKPRGGMLSKAERHALIKRLLLEMPADIGWRPLDLQRALVNRGVTVDYRLLTRDLQDIGATRISRGRYTYTPTPQEVETAQLIVKAVEGSKAK